jgi:hypothetical protein
VATRQVRLPTDDLLARANCWGVAAVSQRSRGEAGVGLAPSSRPVIRYEAYVNGRFDSTWLGNTSTFVYATQNGTNTFTIVAFDSSGNTSQSSVDIHDMWLC